MARKIKRPKIGQYVLVSRWSDKSMQDPWAVGFIDSIHETKDELMVTIEGCNRRWWHFWRITEKEGKDRLNESINE